MNRVWPVSCVLVLTTTFPCYLGWCACTGRLQPALPGLCSALPALPTQQTQSRGFQSISSWHTLRCITTHTLHVYTHKDTTAKCFTMIACHLDFACWFGKTRQTVAVWSRQWLGRAERQWSEPVVVTFYVFNSSKRDFNVFHLCLLRGCRPVASLVAEGGFLKRWQQLDTGVEQ